MEEFHLAVGSDIFFGKHQHGTQRWTVQPALRGRRPTQSTGSFMAITCKHHREQTRGQSDNSEVVANGSCSLWADSLRWWERAPGGLVFLKRPWSLLGETQHRMSPQDRGGPRGRSALEPVAFYGEDGEQILLDVPGRLPPPSAAPQL